MPKGHRRPMPQVTAVDELFGTHRNQFTLHAPVAPTRVLGGQAEDELLDRRRGGRTSGLAARGVVPSSRDQPAVLGQDRGRRDREDLGPAAAGEQSG